MKYLLVAGDIGNSWNWSDIALTSCQRTPSLSWSALSVLHLWICRFLFNDAEVKPFDPGQIAGECFGGEMTVSHKGLRCNILVKCFFVHVNLWNVLWKSHMDKGYLIKFVMVFLLRNIISVFFSTPYTPSVLSVLFSVLCTLHYSCLFFYYYFQSKTYDSVTDKFMDFSFEKVSLTFFFSIS